NRPLSSSPHRLSAGTGSEAAASGSIGPLLCGLLSASAYSVDMCPVYVCAVYFATDDAEGPFSALFIPSDHEPAPGLDPGSDSAAGARDRRRTGPGGGEPSPTPGRSRRHPDGALPSPA